MSIFAGPKLRYLWGKHNEITFKNFDQKGFTKGCIRSMSAQ